MKKHLMRILSVVLAFSLLFSTGVTSFAGEVTALTGDETDTAETVVTRNFYEFVNVLVKIIVAGLMAVYPDPQDWKDIDDFNPDTFLPGRETYQTTAGEDNVWSLGYASESLIPDDLAENKYYLGRDLTERVPTGVNDDMRIRVACFDDNSGEGLVIMGAVDSLGVTSTDTKTIRKAAIAYAKTKGLNIASLNISAVHCHSALDTQGVATGSIKKLLLNGFGNLFGIQTLSGMESADSFKDFFLRQSIAAVCKAIDNMTEGKLYYTTVDGSYYIKDKRELIEKEDIPDIKSMLFIPTDTNVNETYFINITCHPTSFSASEGLVSSDYIYYLDQYINENSPVENGTGANIVLMQGSLGQLSRDNLSYTTEGLDEDELRSAETKCMGETFAKLILEADYSHELAPILNAKHSDFLVTPTNTILILACKARLVNNQVYRTGIGPMDVAVEVEEGYVEFGHELGFALFPVELYPEVFWGTEITDNAHWDNTGWDYPALNESIDDIDLNCLCLVNDAMGYVVPDNYFAYMGHIIKDGTADEILSLGKTAGSTFAGEFLKLAEQINEYNK